EGCIFPLLNPLLCRVSASCFLTALGLPPLRRGAREWRRVLGALAREVQRGGASRSGRAFTARRRDSRLAGGAGQLHLLPFAKTTALAAREVSGSFCKGRAIARSEGRNNRPRQRRHRPAR